MEIHANAPLGPKGRAIMVRSSCIASEYHFAVKTFGGPAYRKAQKKASQGNSGDIYSHQAGRRRRARG